MKLLMHMCCGPCSIYPYSVLKEKYEVTGFSYNPNIHPYTEYKMRMETAMSFAEAEGFPMIVNDDYALEDFLEKAVKTSGKRCHMCYELRLEKTAQEAAKLGFDAFTTTLLVSPYQDQDIIKEIGERLAIKYGIKFHFEDFRSGFRSAQNEARQREMYMQKYCGCIYSEKERYLSKRG